MTWLQASLWCIGLLIGVAMIGALVAVMGRLPDPSSGLEDRMFDRDCR